MTWIRHDDLGSIPNTCMVTVLSILPLFHPTYREIYFQTTNTRGHKNSLKKSCKSRETGHKTWTALYSSLCIKPSKSHKKSYNMSKKSHKVINKICVLSLGGLLVPSSITIESASVKNTINTLTNHRKIYHGMQANSIVCNHTQLLSIASKHWCPIHSVLYLLVPPVLNP